MPDTNAITQLEPAGFAILPQSDQRTGLLPNRQIALWPNTPIRSPHIELGGLAHNFLSDDAIGKAKDRLGKSVGLPAYWQNGTLFVKYAEFRPDLSISILAAPASAIAIPTSWSSRRWGQKLYWSLVNRSPTRGLGD
jgi:hypothetical protein